MARKKRQRVFSDKSDSAENVDFKGPNGLTEKRERFVEAFTIGQTAGNALQSAIAAGYSKKTAGAIGCYLLKQVSVQTAVDAALRAEMAGPLTSNAVRVIRTILADVNAPLKIKADMACKVVEFSGIVERVRIEKAKETGLNDVAAGPKRLGEMTRQELENIVRNGAAIMQAAAALPPSTVEGFAADPGETSDPKRTKVNGFNAIAAQ